ncbi:phage protein Gp37 [Acinetobacter schindleri]|uniref:phage protein Gp37 n=1 Tax=Acinetobacter schindleri TaxID=108981 RepID=UPI0034D6BCF4
MISFGDIEQAVKDLCDQQKSTGKWPWLATVKSYGGEFDEELLDIVKRTPAIWVTTTGDGAPKKLAHNKYQYFVKIAVMVGASSVRNEEARRHGAGADIGSYDMLTEVWKLFIRNDLSVVGMQGLSPLDLGRTKTIFNTLVRNQSLSVLAQEFTTSFTIVASDRDREEAEAEYIHKIHTDYYYQPTEKTDKDPADASDVIQLKE